MRRLDFKRIIEDANELIVLVDGSGKITYVNPAVHRILGYEPEEVIGRPAHELIAPDERSMILDRFRRRMVGEKVPSQYILKLLAKDGAIILGDARFSINEEEPEHRFLQGIVRDISVEEQLKQAVQNEKMYLETLLDNSPSIVVGCDLGGTVTFFNKGAVAVTGRSKEEAIGRRLFELGLVSEPVFARIVKNPGGPMPGGPVESIVITRDGSSRTVGWSLTERRDETGKVVGVLAIGHDLTARVQLENVLRVQSQLLGMQNDIGFLVSSCSDPRQLLDKGLRLLMSHFDFKRGMAFELLNDGRLEQAVAVNASTKEELETGRGMASKAITAREPFFLPEDAVLLDVADKPIGSMTAVALPLKGKDAMLGAMLMCCEVPNLSADDKAGLIAAADILGYAYQTTKLQSQEARSRQLLQIYNDIMVHDVLNYLVPMDVYLDMLQKPGLPDDKRRAYLDKLKHSEGRLNDFVRDFRTLSHAVDSERPLISTSLLRAVQGAIDTSKSRYEGATVFLNIEAATTNPELIVLADEGLSEIFVNLITNAIKFSEPESVRVAIEANPLRAKVVVEDRGPGIPDESKGRIFERGYSKPGDVRKKSTGLGLAIVRALVERYRGRVWIEDRVAGDYSKGARFVVELPLP